MRPYRAELELCAPMREAPTSMPGGVATLTTFGREGRGEGERFSNLTFGVGGWEFPTFRSARVSLVTSAATKEAVFDRTTAFSSWIGPAIAPAGKNRNLQAGALSLQGFPWLGSIHCAFSRGCLSACSSAAR